MWAICTLKEKHRFIPVLFLFLTACGVHEIAEPQTAEFRGAIMGTTYMVKVTTTEDTSELAANIQGRLDEVNSALSNWEPESDVSRFNRTGAGEPVMLTKHSVAVLDNAVSIAEQTGGAYDPTLGPLIDLWGFGKTEQVTFPADQAIDAALADTGYNHLAIEDRVLRKTKPDLQLNLSANAKGYGVDVIAAYLELEGFTDYMIEIGGEVRVLSGTQRKDPWRIGINHPLGGPSDIYKVARLTGQALATSGDYRNYFDKDGIRYSHLLDPRTGKPIQRGVAAVSVIGPDCMTADGLATGLIIMGPEEGIPLIEKMQGYECLFLLYEGEDSLTEQASSGMSAFIAE